MNVSSGRNALIVVLFLTLMGSPAIVSAQFFDDPFGPAIMPFNASPVQPTPSQESGPVIEVDRSTVTLGPTEIRLTMQDGTIITGEMDRPSLVVNTDFGQLDVPISRIKQLRPGLLSNPALNDEIQGLINTLGGDNFEQREEAHKSLERYGHLIYHVLTSAGDGENAEQKRHLDELRQRCSEMMDQGDAFGEAAIEPAWIEYDTVVTDTFEIVGRVDLSNFQVESRYGQLNVAFADVKLVDRMFGQKEAINRRMTVEGTAIAGFSYKSSRIRVARGDRVTISADGQVVMSPWGSNAMTTPDGNQGYGMYKQFPGGALVGRIGESGEEFLVGRQASFVADRDGIIQLGVAVQPDYAQSGYAFPGQYTLRIRVEPE